VRKLFVGLLAIVGLLAAGCIIQFATLYKDDAGRTHFVGLASNLTNADVVDAVVEIRFYDSSNNLLDTRFVNPCTRTLQDHQSSPVESILPPGVTASRTENIVHPLTFGTKLVPDFDVSDVAFEVDGDVTHVTGTVENEDNITFYAVQVCAAFYDDDGEVVRVGRAFVDPAKLSRNDTGDFDIAVEDMPGDVEEYQLWVDATRRNPTDVTAPVVVGPDDVGSVVENTGLLNPAAEDATTGGTDNGFETNPQEAFTDDGDSAVNADNNAAPGDAHLYYDYGIDLPSGADVEGIEVRLDWFLDSADGTNSIGVELSWDGGTTWTSAETDDEESTTEHSVVLGGSSDDWGHTWDDDDLSDANFRVRVTCSSSALRTFNLEWAAVRIYYTD